MTVNSQAFMTIPAPRGLAITAVTSDNEFLYALQPDRKLLFKMDTCGRIICSVCLQRRYTSIHFCSDGKFYATGENDNRKIYVLNKCGNEIGFIEPDISVNSAIFAGPAGTCSDKNCLLSVATLKESFITDKSGRVLSRISFSGPKAFFNATGENNGILYEGLESRNSGDTYIRATLLSSGSTKLLRLPLGYKVRSFFCFGNAFYVYITKNSFRGYVTPVCTYVNGDKIYGEIIQLPESIPDGSVCCFGENSCNSLSCGGTNCNCGITSNQTEMCSGSVSGDSVGPSSCDIEELCRLFNCIKSLCGTVCGCSENSCGCANDGCVSPCNCDSSDVGGENCLPLPICPPPNDCQPCQNKDTDCSGKNLKISFGAS